MFSTGLKRTLAAYLLFLPGGIAMGQAPGEAPLLSVLQPAVNVTYNDATVPATVHFQRSADVSTFRAQINGVDVTDRFIETSNCDSGICDRNALLPAEALLHGANALSVEVNGPNDTVADNGVKFYYDAPQVQQEAVSKLVPAVAVTSVRLSPGKSDQDYKSYEIVIGPGADFPQTVYSASDLTCTAGINSVQVLVLERKTLSPELQNGRACFGDAESLSIFLKAVPANDLVILNNFLGKMANIDTTAIGGGNYRGSEVNTNYYNAIGVAGAPAGTAYESYQPNLSHQQRLGIHWLPPLDGSLMLDIDFNYYFAPKDFPEVRVSSGKEGSASITYNGATWNHPLWSNSLGGFWIMTFDRRLNTVTDSYDLITNSNNPESRRAAIGDLSYLLDVHYKAGDLVVMTTVGVPFRSNTEVTASLWNSIFRLGGNGFMMPRLTTAGSGYSLVSSPDPSYVLANKAQETTTARSGENATLDLVLGRDRLNALGYYQDFPWVSAPAFPVNEWSTTLFQKPTDWPAWTSAQKKAYDDLPNYSQVKEGLGCENCRPFRGYYSDGIPTCTEPRALSFDINSVAYSGNPNYTREDLGAVTKQLAIELGYEGNLYSLCGVIKQLTDASKDTLKSQLKDVGNSISSSLAQKALNAKIEVEELSKYAKYASVGSSIPGIGPAFSAVAATLSASAAVVPSETGVPGKFTYTLAQLNNDADIQFGGRLALVITNLFTAASNDWGKLSKMGPGWGDGVLPWYFCSTCIDAKPPLNSLPVIALGAKRTYYTKLLPTAYSVDSLAERTNPDPKIINRYVVTRLDWICYRPYAGAPEKTIWTYPGINRPSTSDIYVMTETAKANGLIPELRFPTTTLMSDMLDAPVINQRDLTLTGGAGFSYDDFLRLGFQMPGRQGYLPGSQNALCKDGL